MRTRHLLRLVAAAVAAVALAACDRGGDTPAPSTSSSSSLSATETLQPSTGPDPLVPYSPSPTPFTEKTTGFAAETLTLPTSDGGKLYVTLDSTSMTTAFVDGHRSLAVWLTIENPNDKDWTGVPGRNSRLSDELGLSFLPIPNPTDADLHPDPARYGNSNRNLDAAVTIPAGGTLQGAIVFRPTGGNRPISLEMSVDDGRTFVTWETNLGPF
jgi:hypothetical protein